MPSISQESALETISSLALEIARQCPDAADSAKRIAELAAEMRNVTPDRGAIQDVLGADITDNTVSDVHVRSTAEAVIKASQGSG